MMYLSKFFPVALLAAGLLGACSRSGNSGGSIGDQGTSYGAAHKAQPDKLPRNEPDYSGSNLTPAELGSDDADRVITRNIRRGITANGQLSTDAKNIQIITRNGTVRLSGAVKNDQELQTIQQIVQKAGVTSVDNQIEVKTKSE